MRTDASSYPNQQGPVQQAVDLSRLCVVIPAFNEAQGIGDTLRALRAAVPAAELIVVDDGSADDTGAIAAAVEGVRVLTHPRNRGYGASLKTGMKRTERDFVAWYDADGQHRPEDLIAVASAVIGGEVDVAIGARGAESAQVRDRAVGKAVLKWVAQGLSRERIPDLNSGLRCFRREVVMSYLHLLPDAFSASSTSTLFTIKRGHALAWVPIVVEPRVGTSTVKIVADGLHSLHLVVRIIVLFEAFRVFTVAGIALTVPGLVYGLIVAISKGQGFPNLAATMVVAGILTFFMGIIADQLVDLRKERIDELEELMRLRADAVDDE
jgi:glycosyltransferase involved in cell wall biosynthesis